LKGPISALLAFTIVLCALIPSAYGLKVVESNNGVVSTTKIKAPDHGVVVSKTVGYAEGLSSEVVGVGDYENAHWVSNTDGSEARVGVNIDNAASYSYSYSLVPGAGGVWSALDYPYVEASQSLTVLNADQIKTFAEANTANGYHADVSATVEYGSLIGYSNRAFADGPEFSYAEQACDSASGDSVIFESSASDENGDYVRTSMAVTNGEVSDYYNPAQAGSYYDSEEDASTSQALAYQHSGEVHGNEIQSYAESTNSNGDIATASGLVRNGYMTDHLISAVSDDMFLESGQCADYASGKEITFSAQSSNLEGDSAGVSISNTKKGYLSDYYSIAYGPGQGYDIGDAYQLVDEASGKIQFCSWALDAEGGRSEVTTNIGNGFLKSGSEDSNNNAAWATVSGTVADQHIVEASGNKIEIDAALASEGSEYGIKTTLTGHACLSGDMEVTSDGQFAKQGITSATANRVTVEDTRKVGGAEQKVTLQSMDGSFSGTAISQDSGHIIQDAVELAESGDHLKVAGGKYAENVVIEKSLDIEGSGADQTIIDGNHAGSVFRVGEYDHSVNVVLSGMTIQGAEQPYRPGEVDQSPYYGGGIFNAGNLLVKDCVIKDNKAAAAGIGNYKFGTLEVVNCEIFDNEAISNGGGIHNFDETGTVTIKGTKIYDNKAPDGCGGGIINGGTMTIEESTITGNEAAYCGDDIYNGNEKGSEYATITMINSEVGDIYNLGTIITV